jgi:hypothetical protein
MSVHLAEKVTDGMSIRYTKLLTDGILICTKGSRMTRHGLFEVNLAVDGM